MSCRRTKTNRRSSANQQSAGNHSLRLGTGYGERGQQRQGHPSPHFFSLGNLLKMTWGSTWCPTSCVTDDEEKQQRATLSSRRLQISSFCKIYLNNFIRFTLLVCTPVFVYGTSLVILLKYFGADLQRRNDKFQRTIFVNLHTAVLGPGRGFQCWNPVEQGSLKKFYTEKKERIERNKDALYSVLVIDHFLRVSKGSQHSNVSFVNPYWP